MATITKSIGATGRDYSTITLWEADLENVAEYTSGDDAVGECYADADFDENVGISTPTAFHPTVHLTANSAHEHDGTAGSGCVVVKTDNSATFVDLIGASSGITARRISLLEFDADYSGNSRLTNTGININNGYTYVERCILRNQGDSSGNVLGITMNNSSGDDVYVHNNIVYDIYNSGGGQSRGIVAQSNSSSRNRWIYNNTCFDVTNLDGDANGLNWDQQTSIRVKNNIGAGCDYGLRLSSHTGSDVDYNMSDDGTADGTNGVANVTLADQFVSTTSGSEDLHLKAGSDAIDAGTNLGSAYELDIDNVARTGTWDIGADQYVATGPSPLVADTASFALTGVAATLTYNPVYTLNATAASFTLTGVDAGLKATPPPAEYIWSPTLGDETSGTTIANTGSAGSADLTLSGTTSWSTNSDNNGTHAIDVAASAKGELTGLSGTPSAVSIGGWFKSDNADSSELVFNLSSTSDTQFLGFEFRSSGNVRIWSGGVSTEFSHSMTRTDFNHIALVAAGSTATLYINGAQVNTASWSSATLSSVTFGTAGSSAFGLDGLMDTMFLESSEISHADIIALAYDRQSITETVSSTLACDTGSFTFTGVAATLSAGRTLTCDTGSFVLTGIAADLQAGAALNADTASFSLTGIDAGLTASRTLACDTGTFTLTGIAADLQAGIALNADTASFAVTGIDAGLIANRTLACDAGSFTLTGIAADLQAGITLNADPGSFTLTGIDAALTANRTLACDVASFTLTGIAAALETGFTLACDTASFTVTGIDASLVASRLIEPQTASFLLSGLDAALTYTTPDNQAYLVSIRNGSVAVPYAIGSVARPVADGSIEVP